MVTRRLSERDEHASGIRFDELTLVNAFVDTGSGAEVGRVASRIKIKLTETVPRASVIGRESGMDGVAVRKDVVPHAVGLIYFGQRRGVGPEEKQPAVA